MATSTAEFAIVVILAALLLGWTFWRYRVARLIAVIVILANVATAFAGTDSPSPKAGETKPTQTASDDGDRDWGRDDGIATQLTTRSKVVVGGVFVIVLACVVGVLAYRKPDGAAYPEEPSNS